MNFVVLFLVFSQGSHLNTSLYTYHKLGSYSISDFYLNYGVRRYDFRLTLEKRRDDFGLKSISVEIDSVFRNSRLIIGEKSYLVNGPFSTTLDLWGMTMTSPDIDFFVGKTKDYTSALPPTFQDNKYTIGVRLRRNFSYRIPVDFYVLKKHDARAHEGNFSNNSFGTNAEIQFGENLLCGSQIWGSLSDRGLGSSFAVNARYAGQQYGGHAYLRKVFRNYVTPANLNTQPGSYMRFNLYEQPLDWIGFRQDIAYSSFEDIRMGMNTRITRAPLPELSYSVDYSKRTGAVTQSVYSGWRYKRFSVSGDYNWSKFKKGYGLKIVQEIQNFQFWSSLHVCENRVFQFGGLLAATTNIRLKNFIKFTKGDNHTTQSAGAEISFKLLKNLSLNYTYEYIHHNDIDDHFMSFNLSNSLLLDQMGFSFIAGRVFMDLNNNGRYDVEDRIVSDIEVILDGRSITRTGKDGNYQFSFVREGKHTISLNLVSVSAEMGTTKRHFIFDTRFLSKVQVDFPLGELGSIEGRVFYDENKNGRIDDDELGVTNVVLALNGFLTTTDAQGKFRFANVPSGTYGLQLKILPPETHPASPELSYIHVDPGEGVSGYLIGIVKKGRPVKKKVFED